MATRKLPRSVLTGTAVLMVAAGLVFAFWPRPLIVDIGTATRGPMTVAIAEEGRTRVKDAHVVSTPVAGLLLRVEAHPGDPVEGGATVVARMRPTNPDALNARTREQARAAVDAAEAALGVAVASLEAVQADLSLAKTDLDRTRQLAATGTVSQAALQRAESVYAATEAQSHTAVAAIAQRKAELTNAQAQLIGFDDRGLLEALEAQLGDIMPIYSPIDGQILQVLQSDETTLAAGVPILSVGDVKTGLEVVVELISADAVRVSAGDAVSFDHWGGATELIGTVTRVEPVGVTKVSALGVEEQRVTVVIDLTTPYADRAGLGHGYRVDAQIAIWQDADALTLPSAALFRHGDGWAVFAVSDEGRAQRRAVRIGQDNGQQAEVLAGLSEGDRLILHPASDLENGARVAPRVIE